MSARFCAWCDQRLVQRPDERDAKFRARRTCSYMCSARLGNATKMANGNFGKSGGGDQEWRNVGWPLRTGEIDWQGAFARHNIVVNDGGPLRVMRPATHVEGISTAALLMQMGSRR